MTTLLQAQERKQTLQPVPRSTQEMHNNYNDDLQEFRASKAHSLQIKEDMKPCQNPHAPPQCVAHALQEPFRKRARKPETTTDDCPTRGRLHIKCLF